MRRRSATTQYFEMGGNRAIYHDGWIATTTPPAPIWELATGPLPISINGYRWELYQHRRGLLAGQ